MRLWNMLADQFRKCTVLELATVDLEESELEKYEAECAREQAAHTIAYNTERIERLRKTIERMKELK